MIPVHDALPGNPYEEPERIGDEADEDDTNINDVEEEDFYLL